jgi:hypothetical protein
MFMKVVSSLVVVCSVLEGVAVVFLVVKAAVYTNATIKYC